LRKGPAFLLMIFLLLADVCAFPICICAVKENDLAVYSVRTIVVSHTTQDETIENLTEYYQSINLTVWNFTILSANYPTFKISVEKLLNNGSLIVDDYEGNVETGQPDLNMWIISANLSEGQSIYRLASDDVVRIKSEGEKQFAGFLRKTVYAPFNETQSGIESYYGCFWDRETGILCGMSSIQSYYDQANPSVVVLDAKTDIEITETTAWTGSNVEQNGQNWETWIPFLVAISIVLVVVLVAVALLFNRQKKQRKHAKVKSSRMIKKKVV
jgi:hypothetical protein